MKEKSLIYLLLWASNYRSHIWKKHPPPTPRTIILEVSLIPFLIEVGTKGQMPWPYPHSEAEELGYPQCYVHNLGGLIKHGLV